MFEALRDAKVILAILLILVIIGSGVGFFIMAKSVDKKVAERVEQELQQMSGQLEPMVPAYKLRASVPSGKKVEESDLEEVYIPESMSSSFVTNLADIENMYYKVDLAENSFLTKDVIFEEVISDDARFLDVIVHSVPIGLKPGAYVDIRISMPLGEDYIGLAHKKVLEVNNGILKLMVNEKDIHTYNSMLVDSILYPGTQIYALEYVQGTTQRPADVYYPISKNIIAIAQKDPNLLEAIKADILQRREVLETGLSTISPDQERIQAIIERGRAEILRQYSQTYQEAERQRQYEEEQARLQSMYNQ